jgi:hypothetical protein
VDFSDLPVDVNGDGLVDLVQTMYFARVVSSGSRIPARRTRHGSSTSPIAKS